MTRLWDDNEPCQEKRMRISRHQMFMGIARVASMRSTCHRLNVGAVLTVDNNVVSIGYNGSAPGQEHCGGTECKWMGTNGCKVFHAERNALVRRDGIVLPFPTAIYVTHSPCKDCARMIWMESVDKVYYEVEYRDRSPIDYLIAQGIKVYRLLPSGYVVDIQTNQVIHE